jgi:formylglycine-generating enzyme required for sulfatase activity
MPRRTLLLSAPVAAVPFFLFFPAWTAPVLLKKPVKEITNSIGMKLVRIEPGKFRMGSPTDEKDRGDDEHLHEVEITKAFFMGVYPVTQAEYKVVMGQNPSRFSADGIGKDKLKGMDTSRFPAERVDWDNARKFCEKLTALAKEKAAGREYRLPTEAEWEYACRAGTKTRFYTGDDEDDLDKAGWYSGNSDSRTHKVGEKKANAWGLSDMHGNVRQWCSDWYGKDHSQNSDKKYKKGAEKGDPRVLRGGGWDIAAWNCRAAYRSYAAPGYRIDNIGFRVACGVARSR